MATGDVLIFAGAEAGNFDELDGVSGTIASVATTEKKSGTYAYKFDASGTAVGYTRLKKPSTTSSTKAFANLGLADARFGGHLYAKVLPGANDDEILVVNGNFGANKVSVRVTSAGKLAVYTTGTTLAGTGTTTIQQWDYVELKVTGNSGTAPWELRINGVTELSGTVGMAGESVTEVLVGKPTDRNSSTYEFWWDNVAVRDGAWLWDALGAGTGGAQAFLRKPTGAGTYGTWTGTYADVDEIPRDDDTTYLASPATATAHTFAIESGAAAGEVGTPFVVRPFSVARYTGGSRSWRTRMRSGTTNSDQATAFSSASYQWSGQHLYYLDPDDSAAWSTAKVNALEVGILSDSAATGTRCTSAGVMVLTAGTAPTAPIAIAGAPVVAEAVLPSWTVAQGIRIAGSPVVAEVVLPAWTITGLGIDIAGAPVVAEVVLPAWTKSRGINLSPVVAEAVLPAGTKSRGINLSPMVAEAVLPAWTVTQGILIPGTPVVAEAVLPAWTIRKYRPEVAGASAMFVQQADGSEVAGLPGPVLEVAAWETHRYLNRVGNWTASISASQHPVDGRPLAQRIQRGWRISLVQENNHPLFREDLEYLLYQGIVEDKEYSADESGQALCKLSGSFRALELVQRSTPTSAAYEAATVAAVATDIVGGLAGGISYPANASTETVTLRFNPGGDGVQSRFARLVKLGNYARYALRESWELDALEFVQIDNPPDSGYTLVNQEMAGEGQEYAGLAGFALIGGSPLEVKREGRGIVNRIIPFGATESRTFNESRVEPTTAPTITLAVQPTAGKLININGRAYIFASGSTINGYIPIGADVAAARANLIAAVAATDGINTSPHPQVRIGAFTGDTAEIEFIEPVGPNFFISGSWLDDAGNTWDPGETGNQQYTENVPLTLEHATASGPYAIAKRTNADGSAYWFIEDAASITRHGLIEVALHRSDVRNPSDDATTRAAAANVLYAIAAGTLIRQAAAKVYVTIPVANGAQVWALPGDKIKMQYVGNVELTEGVVTWEEFDKWFLVVERHDRGDPSGVRQVSLVLAAPEIDITVPSLPDPVTGEDAPLLPITRGPEDGITTLLNELGLGDDSDPGEDGLGGATSPDCCDDPLEEIEDGPLPPAEILLDGLPPASTAEDVYEGPRLEIVWSTGTWFSGTWQFYIYIGLSWKGDGETPGGSYQVTIEWGDGSKDGYMMDPAAGPTQLFHQYAADQGGTPYFNLIGTAGPYLGRYWSYSPSEPHTPL